MLRSVLGVLALVAVAIVTPGCKKEVAANGAVGSCKSRDQCLSRSTVQVPLAAIREDCTGGKTWIEGPCPTDGALGGCRDIGEDPQELWFYPSNRKDMASTDDVRRFCARRKQMFLPPP